MDVNRRTPMPSLAGAFLGLVLLGCHGHVELPSQYDSLDDWKSAKPLGDVEPAVPAVARGATETAVLWGANGIVSGARLRPDGSWSLTRTQAQFEPFQGLMLPNGRSFFVDRTSLREYTAEGDLKTIDETIQEQFESVFWVSEGTIGVVKSNGIEFRDTVGGVVWGYPIILPPGSSVPFGVDDDHVGIVFVETRLSSSSTVRQMTIEVRTGELSVSDISAEGLFIREIAYDTTTGSPSVVWVHEDGGRFESTFCRMEGNSWAQPEQIARFQDSAFEFNIAVDANSMGEAVIAVIGLDYRALCYRDTPRTFRITELEPGGLPRWSFQAAVNRSGEAILLNDDAEGAVSVYEFQPGKDYFTAFRVRGSGTPISGTQVLVHPDVRHAAIAWLETVDPNLYWTRRTD